MTGAAFLRYVINAFPHKIHIVLTDNGTAFANLPNYRESQGHAPLVGASSIASASKTASSTG